MNIEQFASTHQLDASALAGLVDFLQRSMGEIPEFRAAMQAGGPTADAALCSAVHAWHQKGVAFYSELMACRTERSQAWHAEIAEQTWKAAQRSNAPAGAYLDDIQLEP